MNLTGQKKLNRSVLIFSSSKHLFRSAFILILAMGLLSAAVAAQADEPIVRIETELVPFEVSVTDQNNKPVRGLSRNDFRIFEDGVERPIDFFQPIKKQDENRPLSIVFALDVSGSITSDEIVRLRTAMQTFVTRLADYNSYFAVMTFGMEVRKIQSFTNSPRKLERTFKKVFRESEGLSTHAYDAVDYGIRLLVKDSPPAANNRMPRRAVIVITDGFPVGDSVTPQTVIERANRAETTVYSIILPSFSRVQTDRRPLMTLFEASGLVEKTGGRTFYATEKDFEPLFQSLAEEITSSYVLAFYPKPENRFDGRFHNVRIEAPAGLQIKQNRLGYEIKREKDEQ